jgi:flagellar motor switch protein FliM
MAEILSQQEIDNLLAGITTGGGAAAVIPEPPSTPHEREIQTFDFRLPHRLSKNQLRTLQAVHESFAESLGSYLVTRLQTNVAINVVSVDQLFYSEFVMSVANPSCLYLFRIVESDALAIVEYSPSLVLAMVSRMLGGVNTPEKSTRPITRIEQSIMKGVVARTLTDLQRSWKSIADLTFKSDRYETEADFAQIAPTSEIVLVVSFEVVIAEEKYLMSVCFPTFALEEVLVKLNVQHFSTIDNRSAGEWTDQLLTKIGLTSLEATAYLGDASLTLRDLMSLQVGDVVRTNIPMTAEIELVIGGRTRAWGRPGVSSGKAAAKITRTIADSPKEK